MDCTTLLLRRERCYHKQGLLSGRVVDGGNETSASSVASAVTLLEEFGSKGSSRNAIPASQRCLPLTLAAKRCLAFQHCELEALHYYGTPSDSHGPKALCASYDEGYCFGNPGIMKVDSDASQEREKIFHHHQKAKRRIVNSRDKFKACQTISDRFHQCMQKAMNGKAV
jgi:hypothetical protein